MRYTLTITKVSNSNAQDERGGGNNGQFTFNQYTTTASTQAIGGSVGQPQRRNVGI